MSHLTPSTGRTSPRRFRKRTWIAALGAATLMAATPAVANATPPTHQPPANATYDVHLGAQPGEVPCGPLTVTFTDGERVTTFSNGDVLVTGKLRAVVKSDITGKSVSLNVSGPGRFFPDGTIKGSGSWLLFSSEVLAYATGSISIPAEADGGVNAVTIKGRRVDLCPLLGL